MENFQLENEKKNLNSPMKMFEVERILGKRRNQRDELEYFVKWKNLPDTESTWEPFSNVKYASTPLLEYEYNLRQKSNDVNYKYDLEIYALYQSIRFEKVNEVHHFLEREPEEIVKIFHRDGYLLAQVKWKSEPEIGNIYEDTYFKLDDCIRIKKLQPLLHQKFESFIIDDFE